HVQFKTELPFLEVAAGEVGIGVVESRKRRGVRTGGQVVAKNAPTIPGPALKPRQQVILARNQLQLAATNDPLLPAKFSAATGGLGRSLAPIEIDFRRDRLIRRANQLAIAWRQTHQEPQPALGH